MKTTIDLPDDLVRELKIRAVQDHRRLKDLAAELLRSGLGARSNSKKSPQHIIVTDKKTGLPVIKAPRATAPARDLTPDQIADILIDQEVEWATRKG